jgi:hypothetical protein
MGMISKSDSDVEGMGIISKSDSNQDIEGMEIF